MNKNYHAEYRTGKVEVPGLNLASPDRGSFAVPLVCPGNSRMES